MELVDTSDSKSDFERSDGSSPSSGTIQTLKPRLYRGFFVSGTLLNPTNLKSRILRLICFLIYKLFHVTLNGVSPYGQVTFSQQQEKVTKKCRSEAFFIS